MNKRYWTVEITNWKTLVDQFGLDDTYMGLKSARQISIQMRKEIEGLVEPPKDYSIRCNTESEAICIFKAVYVKQNVIKYEYRGTAN